MGGRWGLGWWGGGEGNVGLFGIWKFAPFISFHLLNIYFRCHQFHPQIIRLDDSVKTGCRKVRCFDTELHKCQKKHKPLQVQATPVLDLKIMRQAYHWLSVITLQLGGSLPWIVSTSECPFPKRLTRRSWAELKLPLLLSPKPGIIYMN